MSSCRPWFLLPALAVFNSGCVLLGVAPPGRADVGPALISSGDAPIPSVRFTVGSHLASAFEKAIPVDVGLGYTLKTGGAEPPEPGSEDAESKLIYYHGGYLEAQYGFQLGSAEWSRAWVGGRGEIIGGGGWGLVARGSWEASTFVEEDGADANERAAAAGAASGRLGVGVFLESGYQRLPIGNTKADAFIISTGISIRFPAFAFAGIFLVPWKGY